MNYAAIGGASGTTFGMGSTGLVIRNNAAGGNGADSWNAMTFNASGRIVVAGHSAASTGALEMALWRNIVNGTPDTSFSSTGVLRLD